MDHPDVIRQRHGVNSVERIALERQRDFKSARVRTGTACCLSIFDQRKGCQRKSGDECTTVVQINYNQVVQTRRKPAAKRRSASVRQSVTIPAQLARELRRVAKERNVTMSRALVTLAEQGVEAEAAARAKLTATYEKFMAESDPARKSEVGEDLIRAIFGRAAIAEDPLH